MGQFALQALLFMAFLMGHAFCHGGEVYDVEMLPFYRTKQYPLTPSKKVVVFSAPRSGSSLVYNVLRFLFEDDSQLLAHHYVISQDRVVLKTHRFADLDMIEEQDVFYVFTLRHPREASISNFRICPREITDNKGFALELAERQRRYLFFSEAMEAEGRNICRLKYEDFNGCFDALFDFIERHFDISIASEDKELMRKGYSKENIYACVQGFEDFSGYFPISGFHGRHVDLGDYTPPADFLYWLDVYLEEMKPVFRKYGYYLGSL